MTANARELQTESGYDIRIPQSLYDRMIDREITVCMFVTMTILYRRVDWRTGIAGNMSASALAALSNHLYHADSFKDALQELDKAGLISRDIVKGSKRPYAVTIHNYKRVENGNVQILNPTSGGVPESSGGFKPPEEGSGGASGGASGGLNPLKSTCITCTTNLSLSVPFPEDFQPSQENILHASENSLDLGDEVKRCRNWALAEGKHLVDWQARFSKWLRDEVKHRKQRPASAPASAPALSAAAARAQRSKQNIIDGITADAHRRAEGETA